MIRKYSKLIVSLAIITNISVGEEFVLPSVTTGSNALKEIKARVNNRGNYNYSIDRRKYLHYNKGCIL